MEKVKAFVKKSKDFICIHKFWFIIGAIAIAIALLFSPLFSIKWTYIRYGDSRKTIIDNKEILYQTPALLIFNIFQGRYQNSDYSLYYEYSPLLLIFFCLFLIAIISIIIYLVLKKNKFLNFSCTINILAFIFFIAELIRLSSLINYTYIEDYVDNLCRVIPHAAFYFTLLLFIVSVIVLSMNIYNAYRKKHPRAPTKNERIAELEKRIEELENRKDG